VLHGGRAVRCIGGGREQAGRERANSNWTFQYRLGHLSNFASIGRDPNRYPPVEKAATVYDLGLKPWDAANQGAIDAS